MRADLIALAVYVVFLLGAVIIVRINYLEAAKAAKAAKASKASKASKAAKATRAHASLDGRLWDQEAIQFGKSQRVGGVERLVQTGYRLQNRSNSPDYLSITASAGVLKLRSNSPYGCNYEYLDEAVMEQDVFKELEKVVYFYEDLGGQKLN